jgi:hypothetical protein
VLLALDWVFQIFIGLSNIITDVAIAKMVDEMSESGAGMTPLGKKAGRNLLGGAGAGAGSGAAKVHRLGSESLPPLLIVREGGEDAVAFQSNRLLHARPGHRASLTRKNSAEAAAERAQADADASRRLTEQYGIRFSVGRQSYVSVTGVQGGAAGPGDSPTPDSGAPADAVPGANDEEKWALGSISRNPLRGLGVGGSGGSSGSPYLDSSGVRVSLNPLALSTASLPTLSMPTAAQSPSPVFGAQGAGVSGSPAFPASDSLRSMQRAHRPTGFVLGSLSGSVGGSFAGPGHGLRASSSFAGIGGIHGALGGSSLLSPGSSLSSLPSLGGVTLGPSALAAATAHGGSESARSAPGGPAGRAARATRGSIYKNHSAAMVKQIKSGLAAHVDSPVQQGLGAGRTSSAGAGDASGVVGSSAGAAGGFATSLVLPDGSVWSAETLMAQQAHLHALTQQLQEELAALRSQQQLHGEMLLSGGESESPSPTSGGGRRADGSLSLRSSSESVSPAQSASRLGSGVTEATLPAGAHRSVSAPSYASGSGAGAPQNPRPSGRGARVASTLMAWGALAEEVGEEGGGEDGDDSRASTPQATPHATLQGSPRGAGGAGAAAEARFVAACSGVPEGGAVPQQPLTAPQTANRTSASVPATAAATPGPSDPSLLQLPAALGAAEPLGGAASRLSRGPPAMAEADLSSSSDGSSFGGDKRVPRRSFVLPATPSGTSGVSRPADSSSARPARPSPTGIRLPATGPAAIASAVTGLASSFGGDAGRGGRASGCGLARVGVGVVLLPSSDDEAAAADAAALQRRREHGGGSSRAGSSRMNFGPRQPATGRRNSSSGGAALALETLSAAVTPAAPATHGLGSGPEV